VEQRVTLITIGVTDLARSRAFYERLGWRGQEVEETVFFQAGTQAIVLWGRDKVAADAAIVDDGARFGGITLAHNVGSRAEVDAVMATAVAAGAEVTKAPAETFYGGYAGFFRDPDGHVWEVAHNPGFTLDADGSLTLPDFGAPS
jgi:catechol 2,3-dioxygenase-like lactoylglutathione lyase family enzyme